ncbi:hypothetical protein ACTXGQ_20800, partial [Marinobacter sp. 1Y8]
MTIASTLRLSLYGVALSAISTLGLIGCSNSSTETAATAENSTATDKPAKSIAITQIVEHPSLDDMRRGIID